MAAHEVKEAARVIADLLAELPQGDELRLALAHGDLFAATKQAHELDQVDFEAVTRLTHGHEPRTDPCDIPVMVRAQDIDEPLKPQLALLEVVRDIGGEIGLYPILANDHTILLIAEFGRSEPDRAILLVEAALGFELLERVVDLALVAQLAFRVPPVENHAELCEVIANIREHFAQRQLENPAESVGADQFACATDQCIDVGVL